MLYPEPNELRADGVRAVIPEEARQRSTAKALFLFCVGMGLYLATFLGTMLAPWWPLKLVFSLGNAFFLSTLFVIGHDACHGSFVPYRWLNALLARISFLPSWHPYSGWQHGHNHNHHVWTNLRQKDFVWVPLSKGEYDALPVWRQALHRFYRTIPGMGVYYFFEIYLPKILFPAKRHRGRKPLGRFLADDLLVACFIAAQAAFLVFAPRWLGVTSPAVESLFFGQWLPFIIWNWLIAFLILLHHTHPRIPWFDTLEEWSFYRGQIQGTSHVIFPGPINWFIHNIMDHTAHHADSRVPLYHLAEAQQCMRRAFAADIVEHRFTLRSFRYMLRVCRLYDYRNHRWLNWAGEPTSSSTIDAAPDPMGNRTESKKGARSLMLPPE